MRQDAGADGAERADMEDNSRPSRTVLQPDRIEPETGQVRKHLLAYKFRTDMLNEEQYRAAMEGKG